MTSEPNHSSTTLSSFPVDIAASRIIRATVRHLHKTKGQKEWQVFLAEDDDGLLFEAWLAYSSLALRQGRRLSEGDIVVLKGFRCEPIRSQRNHGGIHDTRKNLDFFNVLEILS